MRKDRLMLVALPLLLSFGLARHSPVRTKTQMAIPTSVEITTMHYEHIFGSDKRFLQCHASTLVGLDNGSYLFAWFGGTEEKNDDVGIWMAGGTPGKWNKPSLVAKIRNDPHWNPVLFRAPAGRVYLYFKVGKEIDFWETWFIYSDDLGKTWSEPAELVPGDKGGRGPVRNQPIILSDGSWLAPASSERKKVWNVFTDRSEDGGKTWKASNLAEVDRKAITGTGVIQPALWESKTGNVHMLMRSSAGVVCRSDSKDYGRTWSPVYKTTLPNNNSGIDIAQINGDTIAIIYNPVGKNWGDRFPISVAVSTDNGSTWSAPFDIEKGKDGDELSYPDMYYENGNLYASYTWNRKSIAFWEGRLRF